MFGAIHLVRTYLKTEFSPSLPLYAPVHILDEPPLFLQLRTYLMDDLFLNQKIKNNIRISYSLKFEKKNLQEPYPSKDIALDLSYVISH